MRLEKNIFGIQSEEKKGHSALSRLFRLYREKLLKLVTSTDYTDGVEIFAMMVTIHMLLSHRITNFNSTSSDSENLSRWGISMEEFSPDWDYTEELLLECKMILSRRLDDFVTAQLAALREKKIDQKKTGVFSPVSRFPAFIDQLMVFSGSKVCNFCPIYGVFFIDFMSYSVHPDITSLFRTLILLMKRWMI